MLVELQGRTALAASAMPCRAGKSQRRDLDLRLHLPCVCISDTDGAVIFDVGIEPSERLRCQLCLFRIRVYVQTQAGRDPFSV